MYERLKRDGDYLLIFRHDSTGGVWFTSDAESRSVGTDPDIEAKFSALNGLDDFRREDGRFQFKLHYPERNVTNIWRQSNNFAAHDVGQFLRGTNFANGSRPENVGNIVGTWDIVEMANPGSSNYILQRSTTGATDQYRFDTPQTRLRTNTTYTMSCWVAYENESDHDLDCPLFHARWYDGSGTPIASPAAAGEIFESSGNDIVVDGKRWVRRYYRFTTPSTLNTANMFWYMTYGSASPTPTGKQYIANPIITDRPIIKNYPGDYDATSGGVRDYEAIREDSTYSTWGGLEYNTGTQSIGDGSVGSTSWWFVIGAQRANGSGQPGPGVDVNITELWVYAPVGIRIAENCLETRHLNEGASNTVRLYARGVADGSSEIAEGVINESHLLAPEAKETGKMHLFTFTAEGEPAINNSYRLNNTAERGNFINAMNALTDEYFALVSNGSCYSNADVDAALSRFNPVEWRGASYFDKYSYSYTGFGSAQLGFISDRCIFDHPSDGDAEIDVNFESRLTIGVNGFGSPIIETTNKITDTRFVLGDHGVVEGQYLIYKFRAKQDNDDAAATFNLRFYNSTNTEVGRQNGPLLGGGMYETHEFYVQVPAGAHTIGIWTDIESDDHVDYIQVYKSGFETPKFDAPVQSSLNGLAASRFAHSPIAGDPMDQDSWISAYRSDSNLYDEYEMPIKEAGDVQWGGHTLSDRSKMITVSSGTQDLIEFDYVTIDPTRPYYVSMWAQASGKDAGHIYFSARVRNTSGIQDTLIDYTGTETSTYIALDNGEWDDINDDWVLYDSFILPHNWTQQQVEEFADKFRNYFGVVNPEDVPDKLVSKGVGVYNSSMRKFFQWKNDSSILMLRCRDEGSVSPSTTQWCMPIASEVKVASFFENNVRAVDVALK
ncbi:hinge connector of long tail fiber protein distal connector [Vibrio phage D484]